MKRLLILLFASICWTSFSQGYLLSYFTENYNNLTNSTSLNNGSTWDDPDFAIPVGFNFEMLGTTSSQIYMEGAWFGATLSLNNCPVGSQNFFLLPEAADVIDRGYLTGNSLSNISYKLDGFFGNRILKIEWNNVSFSGGNIDAGNIYTDYVNFQVWLYEIDNAIEYRYGPNDIPNPSQIYDGETGTAPSILPQYDCDINDWLGSLYSVEGNPLNPILTTIDPNTGSFNFLNDVIPNGMVYRFSPSAADIIEITATKKELIKVIDILGRKTEAKPNTVNIYVYSDGTTEKIFIAE